LSWLSVAATLFGTGLASSPAFAAPPPPQADASNLVGVLAAVAAVIAATVTGFLTWLVGKQARDASHRASAEVALRDGRLRAAAELRSIADLGTTLQASVEDLERRRDGDGEPLALVGRRATELEVQANFMWDEAGRAHVENFIRFSREASEAPDTGRLRERAAAAVLAGRTANRRLGVVSAALTRAAIDPDAIIPAEVSPHGAGR